MGGVPVVGDIYEGVKDFGQGAIDVVRGAGEFVYDGVRGESTSDAKEKIGGGANNMLTGTFDATFGNSGVVDKMTGGGYQKFRDGLEGVGDFIEGKSVSDNLKQWGSLGMQAGQAYVGMNGVSVAGMDMTKLSGDILQGVDQKYFADKRPMNEGGNINPANNAPQIITTGSNAGSYGGQVSSNNILPFVLLGGLAIIGIFLLTKKRR